MSPQPNQIELTKEGKYRPNLLFKFNCLRSMETSEVEVDEALILDELMKQSDILVNIGANVGYYALRALDMKNLL